MHFGGLPPGFKDAFDRRGDFDDELLSSIMMENERGSRSAPAVTCDALGPKLVNTGRRTMTETQAELNGSKLLLLYFGGSWCPHCVTFRPKIIDAYREMVQTFGEAAVKIVFVSAERSSAEFNKYTGSMPFAAIPYGNSNIDGLFQRFNQRGGIPSTPRRGRKA